MHRARAHSRNIIAHSYNIDRIIVKCEKTSVPLLSMYTPQIVPVNHSFEILTITMV